MWTSRVHPGRYNVDLVVAPEHRRMGIATALLRALAELQPAPQPFIWGAAESDPAHAFAASLGARTIQRSPLDRFSTAHAVRLRPHDRARSVREVTPSAVEHAWADMYEWTHAEWHPVGPGSRGALIEDLWSETDADASSVALLPSGGVGAVVLVFVDSKVPVIAGETASCETSDGARLLEGAIRRSLDELARRGTPEVAFDGHESDPHLMPVLRTLGPLTRWHRIVEFHC